MPAKHLYRKDEEGIYSHIYNKGVEKRIIFGSPEDYNIFLSYLKEYLTPREDPERSKKDFTVNGRTFRGTPHLPKNYFNKVELIAYNLMPDHFHLLLHQKTRGSVESFIRSLCTRYSMYFNKKYHRTGSLFQGPYKSVAIKDKSRLMHLTRALHYAAVHSSYPEYVGLKHTSWVKPSVVLSHFGKARGSYKDFVEKYGLDQKEKELIEEMTLERDIEHLERRGLARDVESPLSEGDAESSEDIDPDVRLKPLQRIPELLTAALVFLFLATLGIRDITASASKRATHSITSSVLSGTVKSENVKLNRKSTQKITPKLIVTVNVDKGSIVNIREAPASSSAKIGQAKAGDTFEFVSLYSEWYGVKLASGQVGFISAKYVKGGELHK